MSNKVHAFLFVSVGLFMIEGVINKPYNKMNLTDFNWEEYIKDNPEETCHPFLRRTIKRYPFKEFIKDYVLMSEDFEIISHENKIMKWPSLKLINYNKKKAVLINLKNLSLFEIIKYEDDLFIEEKPTCFLLRGELSENFEIDRTILKHWNELRKAAEDRFKANRNRIPDADIGR